MKIQLCILTSLFVFSIHLFAQNETNFYISLNTGAGPTVQWQVLKNTNVVDDQGNVISIKTFTTTSWGYHVPVFVPIQFGKNRWRAGVDLGYEYIHFTKEKEPYYFSTATSSGTRYETVPLNISYHLFKAGANFEYDVWLKNKNALSVVLRAGYYCIAKYSYSTMFYTSPFIYGSVGLQASRELTHGFNFVYGINLGLQGYTLKLPSSTIPIAHCIFFQPEVLVGFKKSFGIKAKSKKK